MRQRPTTLPRWTLVWGAMVVVCLASCGKSEESGRRPGSTNTQQADIEGRVTLAGFEDSSGVQVYIPGTSSVSFTDGEGYFRIEGVRPGTYTLMAQREGYQTHRLGDVAVATGDGIDIYTLSPSALQPLQTPEPLDPPSAFGSIVGRVEPGGEDVSAEPVDFSQCRIELVGTAMRTFADPDGSFLLWNIAQGDYVLRAQMAGFAAFEQQITIVAGSNPLTLDIRLEPLNSNFSRREIVGSIGMVYSDGTPSEDFDLVYVSIVELPDFKVHVKEDGSFRIGPLAARVYTLNFVAEGYEPIVAHEVDLTDTTSATVDVVLVEYAIDENAGAVSGRVLKGGEDDDDMSGISVGLTGTSYLALTDVEGAYLLDNIPPGIYTLMAKFEGYLPTSTEVEVFPGEETIVEDLLLEPDLEFPEVMRTDPPNGASGVNIRFEMPIYVRFSKKMEPRSVRSSISIDPPVDFRVYGGREHPQSDFDLVLILIDGSSEEHRIKFDTSYTVTIAAGAKDVEGLELQEPYRAKFTTGKATIIDTFPTDGEKDVIVVPGDPAVVQFNAPIDPQSVEARDFRIRPNGSTLPLVQVTRNIRTGWSSIQIQSNWEADTEYRVTLPRNIKTIDGQKIDGLPYSFEFRTNKAVQYEPPIFNGRERRKRRDRQ